MPVWLEFAFPSNGKVPEAQCQCHQANNVKGFRVMERNRQWGTTAGQFLCHAWGGDPPTLLGRNGHHSHFQLRNCLYWVNYFSQEYESRKQGVRSQS